MSKTRKSVELKAVLECHANGSGWHYITVSREVGDQLPSDGKSRRVVCTLNGKQSFQCGLMPSGGAFYIMVNKRIRTALGVEAGHVLKVSLKPDTSKYGLPMPEELEEVFRQDSEGERLFHSLTAGKQRSLIFMVSSGKDIDRRIQRALLIMKHLKDNNGKLEGEKLYHELRRPLL